MDALEDLEDLENLDIKQNWTIYFLIDLRVVYIITYAYISIVNLISSTANSEATDDKQSTMHFYVSEEHPDAEVSGINDAILWNCRDRSLSIFYYTSLYLMALMALAVALIGFCLTKCFTKCGICISTPKHGLIMLWQIAVLQYVKDEMKNNNTKEKNEVLQILNGEIPKNICNNVLKTYYCKTVIPYFLSILLILIMGFSYLTYDVHPLACLALSSQDSIEYEEGKVTIKVPYGLFIYQVIAASVALLLVFLFLSLSYLFYYLTNQIIHIMKNDVSSHETVMKINTDIKRKRDTEMAMKWMTASAPAKPTTPITCMQCSYACMHTSNMQF